jgi:predicted nucleic acid-binding protein
MILLLDTTVLIDLLRGKQSRKALLADLVKSGHTPATAAINIAEIYAGMRPTEQGRTEFLLAALDCFSTTPAIARRAGSLKKEWAVRGRTLSLPDMIVAATALEHEAVLMTENRKDFQMIRGLELYPLS